MKKNIIAVVVIMLLALTGCSSVVETSDALSSEEPSYEIVAYSQHIGVYVDPETGVNYMIYNGYNSGGMTVRLNADGTPYVTK